jgi:hypothetical protein
MIFQRAARGEAAGRWDRWGWGSTRAPAAHGSRPRGRAGPSTGATRPEAESAGRGARGARQRATAVARGARDAPRRPGSNGEEGGGSARAGGGAAQGKNSRVKWAICSAAKRTGEGAAAAARWLEAKRLAAGPGSVGSEFVQPGWGLLAAALQRRRPAHELAACGVSEEVGTGVCRVASMWGARSARSASPPVREPRAHGAPPPQA